MAERRRIIGVMGASTCGSEIAALAEEVGRQIAIRQGVVLTGGGGGVMEAASRGAKSEGGLVLGILGGTDAMTSRPNDYVDVPLFTGLGHGRNYVNAAACEGIVAVSGKWGTLSEIALARAIGRPVVWLSPTFDLGSEVRVATTAVGAVDSLYGMLGW